VCAAHASLAGKHAALLQALEFLLVPLPILLCFTVTGCTPFVLAALVLFAALLPLSAPPSRGAKGEARGRGGDVGGTAPRRAGWSAAMSGVRAYSMLLTACCILAVDFAVFPRRFAKTERAGFSPMDAGVGLVQLLGALVHDPLPTASSSSSSPSGSSRARALVRSVVSCAPILALGFIRLAVTSAAEYQTHVSEYGAHWNFFFTLAFSRLLVTALAPPRALCLPLAVLLLLGQEALLHAGLARYVLDAPRPLVIGSWADLAGMNREGLASLPGYVALFLAGRGAAPHLLPQRPHSTLPGRLLRLLLLDALLWGLVYFAHAEVAECLRRLANLTYVLWVCAYFLLIFLLIEVVHLFLPPPAAGLVPAWNKNQLALFLSANLATGAVNKTVDTLATPDATALLLLGLYVSGLSAFALYLHRSNFNLKFW
jgi:phosphatidylinositol glycan class W